MRFPKLHRPRSLARDPCTSRRAWLSGRRWRQQMSSEFTINEGRHKIDGQLASKILDLCFWHDQQRRQRGSAERVGTKAAALRLNLFRQKTQIAFGRLGSKLYLLDGYGRLAAVKQTGIAAEFDVAIFTAADEQGLSRLWASFDEAAMQKPRGSAQTAAALGIAEEFGINHLLAKAVLSAMPTIEEGMKFRVGSTAGRKPELRLLGVQANMARAWEVEARAYASACFPPRAQMRNPIVSNSAVAVGLVTFKHQPEKAHRFWAAVAKDTGRVDSPEATLAMAMARGRLKSKHSNGLLLIGAAWNAFYEERSLTLLKTAANGQLTLKGTPVRDVQQFGKSKVDAVAARRESGRFVSGARAQSLDAPTFGDSL